MLTTKNWGSALLLSTTMLLSLVVFQGCQPPGPRALLQGERLIREEKFAQAVEKLETATWLLPQNAQAWNHLGLAYHGAGRPEEATRAYQKAVSLDRNLAAARFNLGMLFLEQNRNAEAAGELTTFTALQPNSTDGWLNLATAQLRARRLDDAEKAFVRVQKLEPNDPEMLDGLGVIQLQRKKPREALNYFAAALKQNPKFAPAILNEAIVLQHYLNNRPAALQKYEEYLALKPASSNLEAVAETTRRLEEELHPKPIALNTNIVVISRTDAQSVPRPTNVASSHVVTNNAIPTVHTNLALKIEPATNAAPSNLLTAPTPNNQLKTEPLIAASKTNPPVAIIEPEPEVKPEVVHVDEDPAPAPARETAQNKPDSKPATSASRTNLTQTTVPETPILLPPLIKPVLREPKPSFVQKLDPRKWFHSREPAPATPVSLSTPPEKDFAPATNPPPKEIAANRIEPAHEPGPVATRRYTFDKFEISPTGDRPAARTDFIKGVTAQNDGRLGAALEAYQQALRTDPAYFEAYYNLALVAYQMHNLPLALSSGERAIRIKPDSADARYNFALALEDSQYPYDAEEQLEQVLAQHPKDARAHFALASLAAETLRNPALAKEQFRKVLELEPNHPNATQIRYWLAAHP